MTKRSATTVVVLVLFVYLGVAAFQAWAMIRSGSALAMGLGFVLLGLPLIGIWAAWRQLKFSWRVQEMGRSLYAEGAVERAGTVPAESGAPVVHDVPIQNPVKADPADWRAWYRLAASYDAEGDRKRARAAMRHALSLYA